MEYYDRMMNTQNSVDTKTNPISENTEHIKMNIVKETVVKRTQHLTNEELAERCIWWHNNNT